MLLSAGLLDQFRELNETAVRLAVKARTQAASPQVVIAGSIAPTTFCLDQTKGYLQQAEAFAGYSEQAFTELKHSWAGTLGVYAHSGVFVMPNWQFNDVISPEEYAREAGSWIQMGAQIIGGCCGIGPAHIGELKKRYCR